MNKCPKCQGINGLRFHKDESFYGMNSHLGCAYCGHIIHRRKGIDKVPDTKHQTGANDDRYRAVMMFKLKKV
jgi:hypothetical protein